MCAVICMLFSLILRLFNLWKLPNVPDCESETTLVLCPDDIAKVAEHYLCGYTTIMATVAILILMGIGSINPTLKY